MEFISRSGNKYWFDNKTGLSLPLTPSLEKYFQDKAYDITKDKEKIDDDEYGYNYKLIKKINKLHQMLVVNPPVKIESDLIKKIILKEGALQLTLGVTEDCNLRCKYCVYSDVYKYSRKPTKKKMSFNIAKKALDYYVSLIKEGRRYNPNRRPAVGFYGGEPLLNFNLIKRCVDYLDSSYPEYNFFFTMTTNGTILDDKKWIYLQEHDFSISISLDGPQEEHDRNRLYKNGKGTFFDIMENIKKMTDSGYDKCQLSTVFDYKSNLFALQDFFNRVDIPKISGATLPGLNDGCQYYNQFSEEDYSQFLKKLDSAFKYYLNNTKNNAEYSSFFDRIFGLNYSKMINMIPILINRENSIIPYTGACIPGRKIFVDVDGNFHMCEKINHYFNIGNIHEGLNFKKIADYIKIYRQRLDKCKLCSISRLCPYCYCMFSKGAQFQNASQFCNQEQVFKKQMSDAFSFAEKNPVLIESLSQDYFTWLAKRSPTMGD
ncbi:radical SAM protein [Methanoregula sp.]|uniref:radical SAM protein n=1 Tax=Methanoregula sp. TaxID=2052170 RepID=UPI0035636677